MALKSCLIRFKSAISPVKSSTSIGILAFEIAAIMAKLLHIWVSLSDKHHLRRHSISFPGTRKFVSDDHDFLLSLARAEFIETVRLVGSYISLVLTGRCTDAQLRDFSVYFTRFGETGSDERRWVMTAREMDGKVDKMERLVCSTRELYKEMIETVELERSLDKLSQKCRCSTSPENLRNKILLKKLKVKRLKTSSLWTQDLDTVTLILVRSTLTVLSRIKQVFQYFSHSQNTGFFESNLEALIPPPSTLGNAALTLRYANLVVIIEKMVRSPRTIGPDLRDALYSLLPVSLQSKLRSRLRCVTSCTVTDVRLANQWRMALATIVDWLSPLAHNTLRWQSERSLEKRGGGSTDYFIRSGVLLLQTLHFAVTEKVETAMEELLVGLNYVCRFEMEMAINHHHHGRID